MDCNGSVSGSIRLGIITFATPYGRLIMTECWAFGNSMNHNLQMEMFLHWKQLVQAGNCGQDGSAD